MYKAHTYLTLRFTYSVATLVENDTEANAYFVFQNKLYAKF